MKTERGLPPFPFQRNASIARLALVPSPQAQASASRAQIDAAILATVEAGLVGRSNNAARRQDQKDKAGLFTDYSHFKQLCLQNMRDAYEQDRQESSRMARNRRLTWLTLFRYFAAHIGLEKSLELVANGRKGLYTCKLIDKAPQDWIMFARYGKRLGFGEEELAGMVRAKQAHMASNPLPCADTHRQADSDAFGSNACTGDPAAMPPATGSGDGTQKLVAHRH